MTRNARTKRVELTSRGISLPVTMDRRLVRQAEFERRPISWLVRAALDVYLSKANNKRYGEEYSAEAA